MPGTVDPAVAADRIVAAALEAALAVTERTAIYSASAAATEAFRVCPARNSGRDLTLN